METVTQTATCEFVVKAVARADGWGSRSIRCRQQVGIRRWIDVVGNEHAACSRHIAERQHRYPPMDMVDVAKREADRSAS